MLKFFADKPVDRQTGRTKTACSQSMDGGALKGENVGYRHFLLFHQNSFS